MSEACRAGCGACCIAPSISSAIPGMPDGKPAGVRCAQLDEQNLCRLFVQLSAAHARRFAIGHTRNG